MISTQLRNKLNNFNDSGFFLIFVLAMLVSYVSIVISGVILIIGYGSWMDTKLFIERLTEGVYCE